MASEFEISGVKRVVEVSSNIGAMCDHCPEKVGLEDFARSVNHYIEQHGYRLLHVGQQTSHDRDAKPWHCTVAVLGSSSPPPITKPVVVFRST